MLFVESFVSAFLKMKRREQIPIAVETKQLIRDFHDDEFIQQDYDIIDKKQVRNQSTYDVFSADTVCQMDLTF